MSLDAGFISRCLKMINIPYIQVFSDYTSQQARKHQQKQTINYADSLIFDS